MIVNIYLFQCSLLSLNLLLVIMVGSGYSGVRVVAHNLYIPCTLHSIEDLPRIFRNSVPNA